MVGAFTISHHTEGATTMFQDGEKQIERILQLTEKCPEPLKAKCFEILLKAYADTESGAGSAPPKHQSRVDGAHEPAKAASDGVSIPAQAAPRFKHMAKRLQVDLETLASLFDFTSDPFTFAPYAISGEGKADRTRNVALFVATKAYLSGTTTWAADWKEVRAECLNQGCYDSSNHAQFLKAGAALFVSVDAGKNLELSGAGQTAAQEFLKRLATGDANAS
jgi:hypothetical protein